MNKKEVIDEAIKACDYGFWAGICGILSPFAALLGLSYFLAFIYVVFLVIALYNLGKLFGDNKIKAAGILQFLGIFLLILAITYISWIFMKTAAGQIFMGTKLSNQTIRSIIPVENLGIFPLIFLATALLIFAVSQILLVYSLLRFSSKLRVRYFQYTAILLCITLIFGFLGFFIPSSAITIVSGLLAFSYFILLALSFRTARNKLMKF